MGIEQRREIPYQEAVAHWYENVYLPIIRIINDQGIMQDFPGRTEADLYLWIARHRSELEDLLGWDVPVGPAAADFASLEGKGSSNLFARLGQRVLDVVMPDELEGPPKTGQWRLERATLKDRLFPELLVGLSTQDSSWLALEQAIPIAMREGGRVSGIFVVSEEADQESEEAIAIRDRFFWRCGEVGLEGRFVTDVGPVAKTLCSRARWSDLLILNLAHRPGKSARSRWTSGFRKLLQRCTRPVLAVPDQVAEMARPLLVYDGGPQSDEAMYVATYMADQWQLPLVVLSIENSAEEPENQVKARSYLERHSVQANYLVEEALDWVIILEKASEYACDFLITGAFDRNPVIGAVTGSAILDFLDETTLPILVCR
jgi:nucleotide-binding universal stress UspA family protein